MAFRLLDFPTLLIYPPAGPAAPPRNLGLAWLASVAASPVFSACSPPPCTACSFGLRYPTLLLQLPPGHPTCPAAPGGLQHLSGRGSPQGLGVRRPRQLQVIGKFPAV